jgi:hypothetical protein
MQISLMIKKFSAVFVILMCAACGIPRINWSETDMTGPPTVAGESTKQFNRCDITSSGSPFSTSGGGIRCDHAFKSKTGVHVDFSQIGNEIGHAMTFSSHLRPYMRKPTAEMTQVPRHSPELGLYLVALNPTVVVGIPAKNYGEGRCSAVGGRDCFNVTELYVQERYAQRTSFGVHYKRLPFVREQSFAWIPSMKQDSIPLPIDGSEVVIVHPTGSVRLIGNEGFWRLK